MKKLKKIFLIILTVLLLFVLIFSGYKVADYHITSKSEAEAFDRLSKIAEINSALTPLKEQNSDLFGRIRIDGTALDYPVMHTPNEPEFYLHRAFDKTYSQSGVPFLSAECFEGCKNYIIYGHNMRNGSMFASILKYEDKEYWKNHRYINFDTPDVQSTYEVVAAFRTDLKTDGKDVFRYYQYTDLTDAAKFNEYIENIKKLAIYDTNITPEFGDELITLSTCAYHTADGRFVVVAKKIT